VLGTILDNIENVAEMMKRVKFPEECYKIKSYGHRIIYQVGYLPLRCL